MNSSVFVWLTPYVIDSYTHGQRKIVAELFIDVMKYPPILEPQAAQISALTIGSSYNDPNFLVPFTACGVQGFTTTPDLPYGVYIEFRDEKMLLLGMPKLEASARSYVVSAWNPTGSATHEMILSVNSPIPRNLTYYNQGQKIGRFEAHMGIFLDLRASNDGGRLNTYSIAPSLPDGLVFSTSTGNIAGIARVPSTRKMYTGALLLII